MAATKGSAAGPAALFRALQKDRVGALHNAEYGIDIEASGLHISQATIDYSPPCSLEDAHATLTAAVSSYLAVRGVIPVIVGGSNDQSYPNAAALIRQLVSSASSPSLLVINVDAHLDVRPLINDRLAHSGSPFRQLLCDEQFLSACSGRLVEFAAQSSQCSALHAQYVLRHSGCSIRWINRMRAGAAGGGQSLLDAFTTELRTADNVFVCFDLDSISSDVMPGVSSPSPLGLSAYEACMIAFSSGRGSNVRMLDMSELNPVVEEKQSAKLAAILLYYFVLGVAGRDR